MRGAGAAGCGLLGVGLAVSLFSKDVAAGGLVIGLIALLAIAAAALDLSQARRPLPDRFLYVGPRFLADTTSGHGRVDWFALADIMDCGGTFTSRGTLLVLRLQLRGREDKPVDVRPTIAVRGNPAEWLQAINRFRDLD